MSHIGRKREAYLLGNVYLVSFGLHLNLFTYKAAREILWDDTQMRYFSFSFENKNLFYCNKANKVSSVILRSWWSSNRWRYTEAYLKLYRKLGKALVLTESPTLYFSCANLHCEGLGADSVPNRITTIMWLTHCGQYGWSRWVQCIR